MSRPIGRAVAPKGQGKVDFNPAPRAASRGLGPVGPQGKVKQGPSSIERLRREKSAKERMESELNIGRDIQMNLLPLVFPPFPDRTEFDVYATLRPARTALLPHRWSKWHLQARQKPVLLPQYAVLRTHSTP